MEQVKQLTALIDAAKKYFDGDIDGSELIDVAKLFRDFNLPLILAAMELAEAYHVDQMIADDETQTTLDVKYENYLKASGSGD